MELVESIESINSRLVDHFGLDTSTSQPIWRVVWSEDQFENRLGTYDDYTPAGLYLRTVTEVRYVPKYRQWVKRKYVLERLVSIPDANLPELPASKVSYEPLWVFETTSGKYLPPRFDACKIIVDAVYAAQGHGDLVKYKDPDYGLLPDEQYEKKTQEIDKLQQELFGNESYVGDALAHKEAIIVPRNFEHNKKVN